MGGLVNVIFCLEFKSQLMKNFFVFIVSSLVLSAMFLFCCGSNDTSTTYDSLALHYTVVNTLPHHAEAFTEGLVIHNNKILESTGQHGTSWIAEVNPNTGAHNKKVILDDRYFGEGITVLNNKIYQLSWKEKTGFIYNAHTYEKIGEWSYSTQGWGITHNGVNLIMSDGTDKLYFLDTLTLKTVKTIYVVDYKTPVKQLNELEFVDGYIFANVWDTNTIVKIDPNSGKVVGKLDLSALKQQARSANPTAEVLNGIAYNPKTKLFLVTGKLWTKTFLIKVNK